MMRPRGQRSEVRASTFQYHPMFLMYRRDMHWHLGTLEDVKTRMRQRMPTSLHRAFKQLCTLRQVREHEDSILPVVHWMEQHGRELGFRIPHAVERARATGRGAYLLALGLSERQLYDLVGNHFDGDAVLLRVGQATSDWLHHGTYEGPTPPAPGRITQIYRRVREAVRAHNVPAEEHSYPADLRDSIYAATAAWAPPSEMAREPASAAAEHGRGMQ